MVALVDRCGPGESRLELFRSVRGYQPRGLWPLDDAAGSARDLSGADRAGTWSGTPSYRAAPLIAGMNPSVSLAGSQTANCGNLAAWDVGGIDFSLLARFKTSSNAGTVLRRDNGAGHTWAIDVDGGVVRAFALAGGSGPVLSGPAVTDGAPHFAAATFTSAGGSTLWVDGVQVATGANRPAITNGGILYLGSYVGNQVLFTGGLGWVAVVPTALTFRDQQAIYHLARRVRRS